jgi:hypothetical protein
MAAKKTEKDHGALLRSAEEDYARRRHLDALGFSTEEAYRLWCRASGFGDALHKGPSERQRERAARQRQKGEEALRAARQFERHPEEVLRRLAAGDTAGLHVERRPELTALRAHFDAAHPCRGVRDAFLRLLLATHKAADFSGDDRVIDAYGRGAHNTYYGGLLALARRHKDWLRAPEGWRPTTHRPRRQFRELAWHLLCRYDDAPAFLESAFFRAESAAADAQRGWFVAAGNGVGLRALPGLPLSLTKRMAHAALTEVPGDLTVEAGLRWAQVVGMGGSERLARAVIGTRLGDSFADEAFWETVVRFLVDNPMLDVAQVGPLVDYLRHERTAPRRPTDRERLPEGFTMKGRTPAALLARVEAWHSRLAQEERRLRGRDLSWEPCGIGGLTWEDRPERPGAGHEAVLWSIEEITTAKGLNAEGAAMHHCVGTYAQACARGGTAVFSLKALRDGDGEPERVMTIAVSRAGVVTEARGKRNALPTATPAESSGSWGVRLSGREAALLARGRRAVQRWAAEHRVTLPNYLMVR